MMRNGCILAGGIFVTLFLSLYQSFWFTAVGSNCTGTAGFNYRDTLACSQGGLLLILWFLNFLICGVLFLLWYSEQVDARIRMSAIAIFAVYIVTVLCFSQQFWMLKPVQHCYWEIGPGEPTPPCPYD